MLAEPRRTGLGHQRAGREQTCYHLTRREGDWLAYLVEMRGQVIPMAKSDNPVALVFYLHVCAATDGSDLSERLAACLPDT